MYYKLIDIEDDLKSNSALPGIKQENYAPQVVANIKLTIEKMEVPVISAHISPDGDAFGAMVALAVHLKNEGKNPIILLGEKDIIPKIFQEIIDTEQLKVSLAMPEKYDGVILLDTPKKENSIIDLSKIASGMPVIDIDHHQGELLMTKSAHTLNTNKFSSTAELVMTSILAHTKLTPNTALSLLLGIVSDTHNMKFSLRPTTEHSVNQLLAQLPKTDKQETAASLYLKLIEMTSEDNERVQECLSKNSQTEKILFRRGKKYNLKTIIIPKETEFENLLSCRKKIADVLGFVKMADLVLVVYFDNDPKKNKTRVSFSRYNQALNDDLDLRLLVAQFGGGGQRGAVGFDFRSKEINEEDEKKQMEKIVTNIQTALNNGSN